MLVDSVYLISAPSAWSVQLREPGRDAASSCASVAVCYCFWHPQGGAAFFPGTGRHAACVLPCSTSLGRHWRCAADCGSFPLWGPAGQPAVSLGPGAQTCALEALQLYAPMGHAVGLSCVSAAMEDTCFQVPHHPPPWLPRKGAMQRSPPASPSPAVIPSADTGCEGGVFAQHAKQGDGPVQRRMSLQAKWPHHA